MVFGIFIFFLCHTKQQKGDKHALVGGVKKADVDASHEESKGGGGGD